jgi:hypothetical protein
METNPQLETARRYVEQTGVSVFLTGKAGTGKTTFLRDIVATTTKRRVVLAPTGVAAVNAGGVTIHSFFQLPFDPYLPDVKELVTEYQMPENRKSLSKTKLNIIRTLELLIIDEISMVRADLMDAIDMTLRRYRRSSRPFGGVQLLLIGDVHQLSPVVTESERTYMQRVYPTPYFFASKALQRMNYVTIELTTVYRQQDAAFVDLLNHVRDNNIDAATLQALNARVEGERLKVKGERTPPITLTTHNRQADAINLRHMEALTGERRVFEALVKGNYPERNFPCDRTLEVKVGERVMFVRNGHGVDGDRSGANDHNGQRYYNGMLGTVTGFIKVDSGELVVGSTGANATHYPLPTTHSSEAIEVINDEGDIISVGCETWESLKYNLDAKTNEITQEVEGTFCQYPLQPAWAVTIHKAQGLTFDRVAIDAADAFAFGQVYVALSRCRTLEGLTLTTPLSPGVAFDDASVSQFISAQPTFEQTAAATDEYERQYRLEKLMELFGVDDLVHLTERLQDYYGKLKNIYPENLNTLNADLATLLNLQSVSEKFKTQLMRLDEAAQNERARQGAEYYLSQLALFNAHLPSLLEVEIDNKETAKSVAEGGNELAEALKVKVACLRSVKEKGYSVQTVQKAKVEALINGEKKSSKKSKEVKQSGSDDINNDFATLLRQWRAAKAKEEGVPAYTILQQKALQSIATNMPRTPQELKKQLGVGPKTIEKYGDEILSIVTDFLAGNL